MGSVSIEVTIELSRCVIEIPEGVYVDRLNLLPATGECQDGRRDE